MVKQLTGGIGADYVIECAGTEATLNQAIHMTNRGGKICLAAFPHEPVTTDLAHLVKNNIYVYGIRGEGRSATRRAMALMAEKRFDATKIHTHTFALADLPTALRYARDRVEDAIKVVVTQQAGWHTRERSGRVELQSREARNLLLCIQCADRLPIRTRRMACKCFGPAEKQRGRLVDIGDPLEAFCRGVEFTGVANARDPGHRSAAAAACCGVSCPASASSS